MTRNYRRLSAQKHAVYSVGDVMAVYRVCRNTVSNWVREGLLPSPCGTPYKFCGSELNHFHQIRRARTKRNLRVDEFKCFRCKAAVLPELASLSFLTNQTGTNTVFADCPDCCAKTSKLINASECDKLMQALNTNTSLQDLAEAEGYLPACIVKISPTKWPEQGTVNDAVIYEWQRFAEKYDKKTVAAHLLTIRELEKFLCDKKFDRLTSADIANFRKSLITRVEANGPDALAPTTARHRASHLAKFLEWLCGQKGYRRLSRSLSDYTVLPRKLDSKRLIDDKEFPTLEQGERMVKSLPSKTPLERRQRAMVAVAFVTGFRASAITSLRLKHIDCERKIALHDGTEIRAKNGKSYKVRWFPRTEYFQAVLHLWMEELRSFGFTPEDALFPVSKDLTAQHAAHNRVASLQGIANLEQAFYRASGSIYKKLTPHSVRDCLAALGNEFCNSPITRKAWSLNLGHSHQKTTETYYGKMSVSEQCDIVKSLCNEAFYSESKKDLMLGYHNRNIERGHPDFEKAAKLVAMAQFGNGRT